MILRPFLVLVAIVALAFPASAAPLLSFQPIDPATTAVAPQVFVADPAAPAVTDDRGLVSAQGYRRVRPDDGPNLEVYNADGDSLLITLDKWRAANGTVEVANNDNESKVTVSLRRLVAFGVYSLFLRTTGANGPQYEPLDGKGQVNTFTADQGGNGGKSVFTTQPIEPGSQIVVVYHSDSAAHGRSPGAFGHTAHQQLIVRVP